MKRLFFLALSFIAFQMQAQNIPNGISYQAIALDENGNPVPGVDIAGRPIDNANIGVRFTLIENSQTGPEVYQETHEATTDLYGLFSLVIGQGSVDFGSWADISWGNSVFLRVELSIENDGDFLVVSEEPLWAVPYSYTSLNVVNNDDADADTLNEIQSLTISNDTLFISKGGYVVFPPDADGNPTNELQTITLNSDSIKLSQGGYVILPTDFDGDPQNEIQFLSIANDTIFLQNGGYVHLGDNDNQNELQFLALQNDTLTLSNGGFVLLPQELDGDTTNEIQNLRFQNDTLYISKQSEITGVYLPLAEKAEKLNDLSDVTYQTSGSLGIGNASLQKDTLGEFNTAVGEYSQANTIFGSRNTSIGSFSLQNNVIGDGNTAVGYQALGNSEQGGSNTAVGDFALAGLSGATNGEQNVAIGAYSLARNTSGSDNVAIGGNSLIQSKSGSGNVAIGTNVGPGLRSGSNNTFVGNNITANDTSVFNSVVLGSSGISAGSNSIVLGNNGSENLYTKAVYHGPSANLVDSTFSSEPLLALNSNTRGFLPPRMTLIERDSLDNPQVGLMIYCTDCITGGEVQAYNGSIWKSSTFSANYSTPSVLTNQPIYVSSDSAHLSALVLNSGGLPLLSAGIQVSENAGFSNSNDYNGNPSAGTLEVGVSNLSSNTTYYYRGFAENSLGKSSGTVGSFTTSMPNSVSQPSISTISSPITNAISAILSGAFINYGNQPVISKGFVYDLNGNLSLAGPKSNEGTGITNFTSVLTNLISDTTYYFRPYAITSTDTIFGATGLFQTEPQNIFFTGQLYGGGVIFYVDSTGQHGLIASLSDLGQFKWGCNGYSIDSTSTDLGSGLSNTFRIATNCFTSDTIAAAECLELTQRGFGDWYLPSYEELILLQDNLYDKGYTQYFGTIEGQYWSSSEDNAQQAKWVQLFTTSQFQSSSNTKNQKRSVHPIRSF
jgi:hypothetical protein